MSSAKFNPAKDISSLDGKVILITGGTQMSLVIDLHSMLTTTGTAGLGANSIRELAKHNPGHIYFTGRSKGKAEALITEIKKATPDARIDYIQEDMKSLESVANATKRFLAMEDRLDVLMCNAGIMCVPAEVTGDGYEVQFQVNHLAHALMIKLLLPLLQTTAAKPGSDVRIINVASSGHQLAPWGGIAFNTLNTDQAYLGITKFVPTWCRYGQSKLCNLLYPEQLAKRYPEITSVSLHPGFIITDLFKDVGFLTALPVRMLYIGRTNTVDEGICNQLWSVGAPKSALKNGEYYDPVGKVGQRIGAAASSQKMAEQLWNYTQKAIAAYN